MNKKRVFYLLTIMMVAMCSATFVSCGSDDDDTSVRNKLVGVWRTTMSSSNWKNIELKVDGTLEYNLKIKDDGTIGYDPTHDQPNEKSYWLYNETDQTITMYTNDRYYNYIYVVSMSNDGNSWNGHDASSGNIYSFIRRTTK